MDPSIEGHVVGPEEGQFVVNPIGGRMVLKVHDADTEGTYSVHDNVLPAGSPGPRPHRHVRHDEVFYVIEGVLTVRMGAACVTAPAGSFVVIPRGVVHQPSNPTDAPVRVLLLFSPGGMDRFFLEAAEQRMPLQAVPTDAGVQARLTAFTARYGYEFADLPAAADDR